LALLTAEEDAAVVELDVLTELLIETMEEPPLKMMPSPASWKVMLPVRVPPDRGSPPPPSVAQDKVPAFTVRT
jgi:hypothetical protein